MAAYYPLTDDYILIDAASRLPPLTIIQTPLIGFYRPLIFLALSVLTSMTGWDIPSLFLGLNVLVHVANATLVAWIVLEWHWPRDAAWVSGAIFLLSPWATEATLWMSGLFDTLATFWMLVAMTAGLRLERPDGSLRWWAGGVAVAAATAAIASKEIAVTLPALFLLNFVLAGRRLGGKTLLLCIAMVLGLCGVLWYRERILPGLGGVYGSYDQLFSFQHVPLALASQFRRLLVPPMFVANEHLAFVRFAAVTAVAILAGAFLRGRRTGVALLLVGGILIACAPTCWAFLPFNSTASGRFLYWPGAWASFAFGGLVTLAVPARLEGQPNMTAIRTALCCIFVAGMFGSALSQWMVWRSAYEIARGVVPQFEVAVRQPGPVHLENLPWKFIEGPYILGPGSLKARFQQPSRLVRSDALELSYGPPLRVVREHRDWATRTNKQILTIRLPFQYQPPARPKAPAPRITNRWTVDFDADGVADRVIFRRGRWFVLTSGGAHLSIVWGRETDVPLVGRVHSRMTPDFVVWRPASGTWHVVSSQNPNERTTVHWGTRGDWPMLADVDGDGRDELIVYRPGNGVVYATDLNGSRWQWTLGVDSTHASRVVMGDWNGGGARPQRISVGTPTDARDSSSTFATRASWVAVVGRWNNDNAQTYVTWQAGTFAKPLEQPGPPIQWGTQGDIPIPGDFDGDGRDDFTVWRPRSGLWFTRPSDTSIGSLVVPWGQTGDIPVGPWLLGSAQP